MNKEKIIFSARVALGWLFFYAGIVKVLDPKWTSAGYLKSAKTFSGFYSWLANGGFIGIVDFLNEWGLTLLGVSLILGIFVRVSSILGIFLMTLYYIPILSFPYVGEHSFLVDEHIIYILVLALFFASDVGKKWGLDKYLPNILQKKKRKKS